MTPLGRPPVILDIVEEHFDELDFLWEHREANLFTPDWTLEDLAEHEERAEAHLDGLRLAELHAVDLAEERLVGGETFATTAAALVLFEAGEAEYHELIREALRTAGPESVDGIRIALRHYPLDGMSETLETLVTGEELFRAAAAADVIAFHRIPVVGLERLLGSDDPPTRALALGAAGRLGLLGQSGLDAALQCAEPDVRSAALRAAARMGFPGLADRCRALATRETDPDPEAVSFLGVLGEPQDVTVLQSLVGREPIAHEAVAALGAAGRVEGVPTLLELMADDALGIVATAAYRRITAAPDVEGHMPFPRPEVPEGEDEEEALPPDPEKAAADWAQRASNMTPESAWQSGVAIADHQLPETLDELPLESRHDVYLRIRSRLGAQAPDLELEALATRQGTALAMQQATA